MTTSTGKQASLAPGRQYSMKIDGIDCADCALKIERAVARLPGVENVRVNAFDRTLKAEGRNIDPGQIIAKVRGLGYRPTESGGRQRTILFVASLDCPDEERAIRLGLESCGASVLSADFESRTITVSHSVERSHLLKLMREIGFPASVVVGPARKEKPWRKALRTALIYVSLAATAAGAALQLLGSPGAVTIPVFLLAIVVGGQGFARKGLLAALRLSLDMNTLMTIAVVGAMALGDWLEAATVVFLFSLAHLLETRSMDRARRAIRELMKIAPRKALVRRGGEEMEVDAGEVDVGDLMIVKPGARIPLDGVVRKGISSVNQAPITGESLPATKRKNDEVFAGTINGEGTLEVEATSLEENSTIARIIHMVQEAQADRAPTERTVDRFARYYTPAVVLTAFLVALIPSLLFGGWTVWFYRALVLLVIACPCALVISTPVGIVSGLTAAARAGVLIKGGAHLERAAEVDLVAFDKTGTLTLGRPTVRGVFPFDGADEKLVLLLAASLERYSEHHLAKAIVEEARRRGLTLLETEEMRAIPGKGVEGEVDGDRVRVGSHRLFAELGLCPRDCDCGTVERQAAGLTLVCVSRGEKALGAITLSDELRPNAREALAGLALAGSVKLAMLTGDNRPTAEEIASQLGIKDVEAELLPQDKLEILRRWQEAGRTVMMVGDGVNDAPALAAADVGAAMGAAGTDVALETADIALMGDDLSKIPFTITHSRRTIRVIRQNIFLSIGFKLIFVLLAVFGWVSLWMAIAADMGVSLAVIGNSLRLLSTRKT